MQTSCQKCIIMKCFGWLTLGGNHVSENAMLRCLRSGIGAIRRKIMCVRAHQRNIQKVPCFHRVDTLGEHCQPAVRISSGSLFEAPQVRCGTVLLAVVFLLLREEADGLRIRLWLARPCARP